MTMTPTKTTTRTAAATTTTTTATNGRYEFRLFAATTNFHENSRVVLLFLLPLPLPCEARHAVVSSSFEIAHISVPTEHPTVNFTLFAHSPTSVKIRYRTLFLRLFYASLSVSVCLFVSLSLSLSLFPPFLSLTISEGLSDASSVQKYFNKRFDFIFHIEKRI